jgi:hypothetical protein
VRQESIADIMRSLVEECIVVGHAETRFFSDSGPSAAVEGIAALAP